MDITNEYIHRAPEGNMHMWWTYDGPDPDRPNRTPSLEVSVVRVWNKNTWRRGRIIIRNAATGASRTFDIAPQQDTGNITLSPSENYVYDPETAWGFSARWLDVG